MTITLTKAPHIALQNIKRVAHFSEETHCYTAVLYVDGEFRELERLVDDVH
jgi:hypothetical protein